MTQAPTAEAPTDGAGQTGQIGGQTGQTGGQTGDEGTSGRVGVRIAIVAASHSGRAVRAAQLAQAAQTATGES